MNYELITGLNLKENDCLVIGLFSEFDLSTYNTFFAKELTNLISRLEKKLKEEGDFTWQADFNGYSLMLIHCGEKNKFSLSSLKKRLANIHQTLIAQHIQSATLMLPQVASLSPDQQLLQMLVKMEDLNYQFKDYKTQDKKVHELNSLQVYLEEAHSEVLTQVECVAKAMALIKNLGNLPANRCTPTYMGQEALRVSQEQTDIHAKVMGLKEITELKMGGLLAVAKGSVEAPCFIELSYSGEGASETQPIVLIGKGITFDSGGISLKPEEKMDEMKFDMAGAAAVLGTIYAAALLKLPLNLKGLMACAENMPSGSAMKPGDIITSLSGQTIEILNTDAEGRLALADALTYAERFNPRYVIDMATLTGSVISTLGSHISGLLSPNDELAELLLTAGKTSGDYVWRLPLDEAYEEALESHFADLANVGPNRNAGCVSATSFLSRFAKKYTWAHLDIAGTAWRSGKVSQATGRPLMLLLEFLQNVSHSS